MLIWLLVFLLLFTLVYVAYRIYINSHKKDVPKKDEHYYTFKI
ncbi:hypothetical protein [Sulfurimonas sp.]